MGVRLLLPTRPACVRWCRCCFRPCLCWPPCKRRATAMTSGLGAHRRAVFIAVAALLLCWLVPETSAFLPHCAPRFAASAVARRPAEGRVAPLKMSVAEPPSASSAVSSEISDRVIRISERAMAHLQELREKQPGAQHLYLRMGVRSGGCSGMSYAMDLIQANQVTDEDHVEDYPEHGFSCVVDPASLLYLFGLVLDYKDALIGGGFQFMNPNAEETCGCGKSFGV